LLVSRGGPRFSESTSGPIALARDIIKTSQHFVHQQLGHFTEQQSYLGKASFAINKIASSLKCPTLARPAPRGFAEYA
jgi:hypothetical protein